MAMNEHTDDIFESLRQRDLLSATIVLMGNNVPLRPSAEAQISAIALLDWLRQEEVNRRISWPQDRILPATSAVDREYGPSVIAVENQVIWWAYLDDRAATDPLVHIHVEPTLPEGTKGELLCSLPLSEFLFRIVPRRRRFQGVLKCRLVGDLDDYLVLSPRIVPGYTSAWGAHYCGPGWWRSGSTFQCDDIKSFLAEFGHLGTEWVAQ